MWGSVSAELLLLRKRAGTWVLLGLWLALTFTFAYAFPYVTYRSDSGTGRFAEPLTDLLPAGLVGNVLGGFPFYGGALALILGVLAVGSEYGWGTWKTVFTQRPGRLRIVAAKLAALGIWLVPFVLAAFAIGAVSSYLIALREDAAIDWPGAWLLARALGAAWLVLAVWAALGVLLAVLTRGTALAIGIGILYGLAIEGLLSAFLDQVDLLSPLVEVLLRANAYSLVAPLSASIREAATENGPGAFAGPYVGGEQAFLVLAAYLAGFVAVAAVLLRRRDVA